MAHNKYKRPTQVNKDLLSTFVEKVGKITMEDLRVLSKDSDIPVEKLVGEEKLRTFLEMLNGDASLHRLLFGSDEIYADTREDMNGFSIFQEIKGYQKVGEN